LKTQIQQGTVFQLSGLAILCVVTFFYGLGSLPFVGPDEPRYAEVAREMYETGDWITPRIDGIPWFEKPALLYWIAAAGYSALGVSEFAARVGVALTAAAGVFLLYFFGWRTGSGLTGYLSAATLTTLSLWVGFARGVTSDLPLAVAIEAALLSFFWWHVEREDSRAGNLGWYVCCLALGFAVLAKGLVGIVLPGAIIGLYLILTRQLLDLLRKPRLLLIGAIIFFVSAGTWYGPMFARHGWVFFHDFFVAHHFERYLTDKYRHPQPFFFFFLVALAGSFPWTAYLVAGAVADGRRRRSILSQPSNRLRPFLWLWILIPVIFFSFSGSKLPGYILPIFPAIALLVGEEVDGEKAGWPIWTTVTILILGGLIFGWRGGNELGISNRAAWTIAVLGMLVAAISAAIVFWRDARAAAIFMPFGLGILVIAATHLIYPALAARESIRELAELARREARSGDRLVFFLNSNPGINFYATSLPLRDERAEPLIIRHEDEFPAFLTGRRLDSVLVLSYERWSGGIVRSDRLRTDLIARQARGIPCSPGCDWVLLRVALR